MHNELDPPFLNWENGMLLSESHFQQLQNAISSRLADQMSVSLTNHNFGLLPPAVSLSVNPNYPEVQIDKINNTAIIKHLRAILPSGNRLEITPNLINKYDIPAALRQVSVEKKEDGKYLIIVEINSHESRKIGRIDHSDKIASILPKILFSFYPITDLEESSTDLEESSNHIGTSFPIARIQVINGKAAKLDYIPPCLFMKSHPFLLGRALKYKGILADLCGEALILSIKNARKKINPKKKSGLRAQNTYRIARNLQTFLDHNFYHLAYTIDSSSPSNVFAFCQSIAKIIRTEIDLLPEIENHELLGFYEEALLSDFTFEKANSFSEVIKGMCNIRYNHLDILASFSLCTEFLKALKFLFTQLASTNFEYISVKPKAWWQF